MRVSEIVEPPSLAFQLEGKSNQAMAERVKEKVEPQTQPEEVTDYEKAQHIIDLKV